MTQVQKHPEDNRDPISKKPGAHPVGTGVGATVGGVAGIAAGGAAGAALAGAAMGSAAGPIGAAAGLVVGAVAGGLAGKGVAEKIDPTAEEAYWRTEHVKQPYYQAGKSYDDYAPAYRTGYTGYGRYAGKRFEDVESQLRTDYERERGTSTLGWDNARNATRAAWDRVERAMPGDADRDGK